MAELIANVLFTGQVATLIEGEIADDGSPIYKCSGRRYSAPLRIGIMDKHGKPVHGENLWVALRAIAPEADK
ncbi:hypothetical protein B1F73_23820 [Pseudomonas syringae]|nr:MULTISPECIES: hypothetical protein [Pseudomonas]NAP03266.1 hypothetical protein [Pseudomonas syringae]NAP23353.1 hypothetical protein [Pseudomonas syringae]NAP48003.1 hypothetical protein [Pseudomonas syringae]NAP84359.1 hypothetical protein [Pseudomonas syringae]RXT94763.1 hypothetical protein B1F73_23820 [Pseudomonas syringae]